MTDPLLGLQSTGAPINPPNHSSPHGSRLASPISPRIETSADASTNRLGPAGARARRPRSTFVAAYITAIFAFSTAANAGGIITFTNAPVLIVKPSTMTGKNPAGVIYGPLPGTAGPTITPLNNAPDQGFKLTDFEISYTTVAADFPQGKPIPSISISWVMQRTFTYTTGAYTTTASLDGSVQVPVGATVNDISLANVPPPHQTLSSVSFGPFNNNGNFKQSMTSKAFQMFQPAPNQLGMDILGQEGYINFTPSAVGQTFTFDFAGSAISTVAAVPEPSTFVLAATATLAGLAVLRKNRAKIRVA